MEEVAQHHTAIGAEQGMEPQSPEDPDFPEEKWFGGFFKPQKPFSKGPTTNQWDQAGCGSSWVGPGALPHPAAPPLSSGF